MNTYTPTIPYEQVLQYARQLPFVEQDRLIQELERVRDEELEQACQKALAHGQNPEIVQQVYERKMNPIMLAYGLLKDDPDFEDLTEVISLNRQRPPTRSEVHFEDT